MTRALLLESLADAIDSIERPHPVRVAIDGVDAAGKTVLADELVAPLEQRGRSVIRASIDGFHNPRHVRYGRGETSHEGYYLDSFDHSGIRSSLLVPLGPGGDGRYRTAIFDFLTDSPVSSDERRAGPVAVLLFDGVFLLRPELRDLWDFTVFVDVSFHISVDRALRRDEKLFGSRRATKRRYAERYLPGQRMYLEICRPRELADAVVHNDDPSDPTMELRGVGRA
jgi:uridine kinase